MAENNNPTAGSPCVFYRPASCTKFCIEAHCGNDRSKCVDCAISSSDEHAPTIAQLLDLYQMAAKKRELSKTTISNNVRKFRKLTRDAGLSLDDKYHKLTTEAMENAMAKWGNLSKMTIEGLLMSATSVTGKAAVAEYKKQGVVVTPYTLPEYKKSRFRYTMLPKSVLWEIDEWHDELFSSDPQMWMLLTLALGFGMRCRDIRLAKWDDFKIVDGRPFHIYTPMKTKETANGRTVRWEVGDKLWWKIQRIREKMPDHANGRIFRGTGDWGANWRLGKKFNKALRKRIPAIQKTYKAMHELRKVAVDQIYHAYGAEAAVAFSGDNIKTIMRHYADQSVVNFHPKSIFDMISA